MFRLMSSLPFTVSASGLKDTVTGAYGPLVSHSQILLLLAAFVMEKFTFFFPLAFWVDFLLLICLFSVCFIVVVLRAQHFRAQKLGRYLRSYAP